MSTALAVHTATGGYKFNTINRKTSYIHIQIAEQALGKKLPKNAEVHHVNGDPSDNRNSNLVICQDHKYHSLLHVREEALAVTGNPNLRLCQICQIYDNPIRMKSHYNQFYHTTCKKIEARKRRAKLKAQGENNE